jgi:Histidine kinase-, DNA gyrase B-, and HSP90-like ATPase
MPHVRIDDSFFKKERDQAYSDWETAVWRELFQNSIDQGCSSIKIGLENENVDNFVRLTFTDNGPGMKRDVLENVYFAIGATTKTDSNQIGGMGRARVLTCFSMKSYRILSDYYEVVGAGGEYVINDTGHNQGCSIIIDMEDTSVDVMKTKLVAFLAECRISTRIFFNGELLSVPTANFGKYIRSFNLPSGDEFAKVYVNKSSNCHRLIVRVNGVSMFSTRILAAAQVIVELDPSKSRQVLTANRDGFHWSYRPIMDAFIAELSINTKSALLPRFPRKKSVARGGGFKIVTNNRRDDNMEMAKFGNSLHKAMVEKLPISNFLTKNNTPAAVTFLENSEPKSIHGFLEWFDHNFGDIFIFEETENFSVHKVVNNYYPENWYPQEVNGKSFRKGGNIIKVLLMWKTAITYALEVGLPKMGQNMVSYSVGFVFSDTVAAQHRTEDDGHLFLLMPVKADGRLAYSVRAKDSLKSFMSMAKHEVTHVVHSWHNEDFCRLREDIDMLFDEAECFRRMKKALAEMPDCGE